MGEIITHTTEDNEEPRPYTRDSNTGPRVDAEGVEWYACDPYPTWYRYSLKGDLTVGSPDFSHEASTAKVILFRESGKYYTEKEWVIPENCITPSSMIYSINFRRIDNGKVLVVTQEPWGYPCLL